MSSYQNNYDFIPTESKSDILECYNINHCATEFAKETWNVIMKNSSIALFVLFSNYFFAILPALIVFFQKIRMKKDKKVKITPLLNVISIFFFILPLLVNLYQLVVFKRFISLRMTRTFFFGQIVSLLIYGLSQSNYILNKIAILPLWLIILITLLFYLLCFIMYIPTASEFVKN